MCGVAQVVRMLLLLFISLSVRIGGGVLAHWGRGREGKHTDTAHRQKLAHRQSFGQKRPQKTFFSGIFQDLAGWRRDSLQ